MVPVTTAPTVPVDIPAADAGPAPVGGTLALEVPGVADA